MRSYLNSTLVACVILASAACAQNPHVDPWQRLDQQLSMVTSLHLSKVPLTQALATLGERTGLQFTLDAKGLDDLGLAPDEKVSISIESVPLETLLRFLLEPLDLTWTNRGGVFVVTSHEEVLEELVVRVYAVPDLVGAFDTQTEQGFDYDTLIDTIISTVDSDSWVENGGPEAEIRPFPYASALVISQTIQSHRKIERLLADLRQLRVQQGLPIASSSATINPTAARPPRHKTYMQSPTSTPLPRTYEE